MWPTAAADRGRHRARLLLQPVARAEPKYFYDSLGSHLFEAITELPEYYPTRTEAAIFATHGAEMAREIGAGATLDRSRRGQLREGGAPVPVAGAESLCRGRHLGRLPARRVEAACSANIRCSTSSGSGQDFSARLDIDAELLSERTAFFYPGSSIGNYTRRPRRSPSCAGCVPRPMAAGC